MTAPYGPPPAPRRRRRGVVGPLVLIFIGGVFLLQNEGYLPPDFWMNLWRLWPLVLVLAGIELLLASRIPWLALAGLTAVVLVLGAVMSMPTSRFGSAGPLAALAPLPPLSSTVQTDLGGATQAAITVRFGAGQLNIGPLVQPTDNELAGMAYDGPPDMAPQATYTPDGGTGQLDYQVYGHGPGVFPFVGGRPSARMDLNVSPRVPITSLTVQSGATDARLDLSNLLVSNLDLSLGVASTWIRLPEAAGTTSAHISGGASTITLEIPPGVGAQIRHRGGLNTVHVDQNRFPAVGDGLYRSADYATATNRVDISIETGVTSIQVS